MYVLPISSKIAVIFRNFLETRTQSHIWNACFPFRMRVSPIFSFLLFVETNSKTKHD